MLNMLNPHFGKWRWRRWRWGLPPSADGPFLSHAPVWTVNMVLCREKVAAASSLFWFPGLSKTADGELGYRWRAGAGAEVGGSEGVSQRRFPLLPFDEADLGEKRGKRRR